MTKPCPMDLDCLIFASECGYPGWTDLPCITWLLCNECSQREESEQLKPEIERLRFIFMHENDRDKLQQAFLTHLKK